MSTIEDEVSIRVASAIRARREQLGLTLRSLASKSGVSSSMISDVERGTKSPTIATLAALAQALGVPLAALVESAAPPAGRIHVVRADERAETIDPASGARRHDFRALVIGSKVGFMRCVVPAHAMAGPFAAHARGTVEHMHLAAGHVRVEFGTDSVTLEAGDSCSCAADATHYFDNREGGVEALIYIVIEPP
jgi:transcriptional regulator with XRE-family HTH domain